ncbi:MAG: PTS transporter subunit EIIC [Longicatena sp.]|uniref:PTS sugar transporter subunit IIC n=1 Tax=Anaerorhabdus sp. TaxID=1872524 RepID=UPI002FCB3422
MKRFMDWMTNKFAPKMNKIARNPWVAAIQEAILTAMPVIFIGSFVTVLTAFGGLIKGFPDFGPISTFSIGLLSLFLSYLVPYLIMEKKKHNKTKREAGIAGVAFFLMLVGPTFDEAGNIIFSLSSLGNGGMIAALMAGLFVGFVMNIFSQHSFFKEDSAIPDFITVWFDTLIPILVILFVGWLLVFQLKLNIFNMIYQLFTPILTAGDSFIGFVLLYFIGYTFLYTFGISTWVIYPIESAIIMQGIAANQAAVAAGMAPTVLNAYGVSYYWTLGGGGVTLALGLMMLFFAKSKKCKVIGKASAIPSLCNINEPLVFGAPIAFNPILMVPMWIIGLLGPALAWIALNLNLIPKVSELFSFWYLPFPITTWFVGGMSGLLFSLGIFGLSWLVYYPFFKVYDKQCVSDEEAEYKNKEEKMKLEEKKAARNQKLVNE